MTKGEICLLRFLMRNPSGFNSSGPVVLSVFKRTIIVSVVLYYFLVTGLVFYIVERVLTFNDYIEVKTSSNWWL